MTEKILHIGVGEPARTAYEDWCKVMVHKRHIDICWDAWQAGMEYQASTAKPAPAPLVEDKEKCFANWWNDNRHDLLTRIGLFAALQLAWIAGHKHAKQALGRDNKVKEGGE